MSDFKLFESDTSVVYTFAFAFYGIYKTRAKNDCFVKLMHIQKYFTISSATIIDYAANPIAFTVTFNDQLSNIFADAANIAHSSTLSIGNMVKGTDFNYDANDFTYTGNQITGTLTFTPSTDALPFNLPIVFALPSTPTVKAGCNRVFSTAGSSYAFDGKPLTLSSNGFSFRINTLSSADSVSI